MSTGIEVKNYKLKALPNKPIPNAILYIKADGDTTISTYITDVNGIPYPLKDDASTSSGVQTVFNTDGTISVIGSENVKVSLSSALLNLINSSLQPGDNISDLLNDEGYLKAVDLPNTKAEFNSQLTDGDFLFVGDVVGGVQSVTGDFVDNSDPLNPIINFPTSNIVPIDQKLIFKYNNNLNNNLLQVGDLVETIIGSEKITGLYLGGDILNKESYNILTIIDLSEDIITEFNYVDNSDGFFNNLYEIQEENKVIRSSFAEVSYQTDHEVLEVTWVHNNSLEPPLYLNVFINNVLYTVLQPTVLEFTTTKNITLPSGNKNILIRQGALSAVGDAPLDGGAITKIVFSLGSFATPYIPERKNKRIVVASDSIGVGGGTTNNGIKSWVTLLRDDDLDIEIASIGGAGAYSSVVQTNEIAQNIVDHLIGAVDKILWWSLGANDYGQDPTTWGTNLANWLDLIHSMDSEIIIYVQTMIYRESYNDQLEVLRQKERDICTGRNWCTIVEAGNWIPLDQYVQDDLLVHPNDEGNITYSNKVKDIIFPLPMNVSGKIFSAYKLDNGIDSKGGHNGTVGSAVSFSSGVSGNGANFITDTNSIIVIPNNNAFNFSDGTLDKPFSIKFNIKLTSSTNQLIINKRDATSGGDEFQIICFGTTLSLVLFSSDNSNSISGKSKSLDLNIYYCITVHYDGSKTSDGIDITINATSPYVEKTTTGTYLGIPVGNSPVSIGRAGWADGLWLNGQLDELYFFNGVLTPQEIKYLQNNFYPFT